MCCFYHTGNTINLVTASVDASVGIVEHTIFIPDVVEAARRRTGSFSPNTPLRLRSSKVDML
jgi:hypothetical protein